MLDWAAGGNAVKQKVFLIDADTHGRAKAAAARAGMTLQDWVWNAIVAALAAGVER